MKSLLRFALTFSFTLLLGTILGQLPLAQGDELVTQKVVEGGTEASVGGTGDSTGATSRLLDHNRNETTIDRIEGGDGYGNKEAVDIGKNSSPGAVVPIRPMQGFQQIANSGSVKGMLKNLIVAEVPVMYQTMMMVENGAATGFIGAMGSVGDLLDSTMQASRLQLAMYDSFDDSGFQKKAYQQAILTEMTDGEHKDSWPSALWGAVADKVKDQPTPMPDYSSQHVSQQGPTAKILGATTSPGTGSPTETSASEIIFKRDDSGEEGEEGKYSNTLLDDWKKAFVEMIGDIKIKITPKDEGFQQVEFKYVNAVESGVKAIDSKKEKNSRKAYKGLLKILGAYCNFKNKDDNYSKAIFEKTKPGDLLSQKGGLGGTGFGAGWLSFGDNLQEARLDASSPDMPLTVNFVDALYNVGVGQADLSPDGIFTGGDCDKIFSESKPMPSESEEQAKKTGTTWDDCKDNTCLIHRIVETNSLFVGRSRTYHEYMHLLRTTYRLLEHQPALRVEVNKLIESNLDTIKIESEMADNQERWINFTNELSAIAQGRVGSTVFRPTSGNITSNGVDQAR
jgi:hypothetical protein